MASSTLLQQITLINLFYVFQKFVETFDLLKLLSTNKSSHSFHLRYFCFHFLYILFLSTCFIRHPKPEFFRQFNVNFNLQLILKEHIPFLLFFGVTDNPSAFYYSMFYYKLSQLTRGHIEFLDLHTFLSYYLFGHLVKLYYLIISCVLSSTASLYRFGLVKANLNFFLSLYFI